MLIVSKLDDMLVEIEVKKKKLIYFENRSLRLKESTVKSFKKQHQEDLKKQDPRNDHL